MLCKMPSTRVSGGILTPVSGLRRFVDVRAAMGFTPIHMAASQGHWQTVAVLLANGASLAVRFCCASQPW